MSLDAISMTKKELIEMVKKELDNEIALDQAIFYALGDERSPKWKEALKLVPQKFLEEHKEEIDLAMEVYHYLDRLGYALVLWIYSLFGRDYTTT